MGASVLNDSSSQPVEKENAIPQVSWPAAPERLELEPGQVHVFCAAPSEFKGHCARLERLLSRSEVERAGRFHFAKDRTYYIVRHGLLRLILGQSLSLNPSELEFETGDFGKPALKSRAMDFNQSDSGELVLLGVTTGGPLGVDIEAVRPVPEFEDIAAQYFCSPEVRMMRVLPEARRMKAFYSCWTAKEAYLKATGQGIADGLNRVEVALDSELQAQSLHLPGDSEHSWDLRSFAPASGYLAAVAAHFPISSQRLWRITDSFLAR